MPDSTARVQEWNVAIQYSGKVQRAILCVSPDKPFIERAWLNRVGSSRSPLNLYPGTDLVVLHGPDEALFQARLHGFLVGGTDSANEHFTDLVHEHYDRLHERQTGTTP